MRISVALVRLITLLYISFVLLPFFLGWVKLIYGIPLVAIYFFGVVTYARALDYSKKEIIPYSTLVVSTLLIFVWVGLSGAGGMGYQVSDLYKSNTLIKELTNNSWPLEYNVDGERMYLSHYLGYYLPGPAVVGFLGYKYVQLFLFFYTWLGILLGFFFLNRFVGERKVLFTGFLILFGGITTFSFVLKFGGDALGEFISRVQDHSYVFWLNSWDVIPLNYMAISDMLMWTPQHVIPTLIGVGVMLNDCFVDKDIRFMPFFVSLLAIWSPLVLVGLFPLFLFVLLYQRLHGILNVLNFIVAPIIFGVVALFLLAIESGDLVKHFIFTDLSERDLSLLDQVGTYLYFLFFEVFIWAIPIYFTLKNTFGQGEKRLFFFTVVLLTLIPLYRFGLWNDWCNRVSMPAIVVLGIFAFKAIVEARGLKLGLLVVLFLLGTHAATIGMVGSYIKLGNKVGFYPPEEHQVQTLPEICVGYPITQFVASEEAFFFKYLAKKPSK